MTQSAARVSALPVGRDGEGQGSHRAPWLLRPLLLASLGGSCFTPPDPALNAHGRDEFPPGGISWAMSRGGTSPPSSQRGCSEAIFSYGSPTAKVKEQLTKVVRLASLTGPDAGPDAGKESPWALRC
jgi:hypothetical protein